MRISLCIGIRFRYYDWWWCVHTFYYFFWSLLCYVQIYTFTHILLNKTNNKMICTANPNLSLPQDRWAFVRLSGPEHLLAGCRGASPRSTDRSFLLASCSGWPRTGTFTDGCASFRRSWLILLIDMRTPWLERLVYGVVTSFSHRLTSSASSKQLTGNRESQYRLDAPASFAWFASLCIRLVPFLTISRRPRLGVFLSCYLLFERSRIIFLVLLFDEIDLGIGHCPLSLSANKRLLTDPRIITLNVWRFFNRASFICFRIIFHRCHQRAKLIHTQEMIVIGQPLW